MTFPTATYRIQFRNGMTFDRARGLIPYLKTLGISHLYASPIFTAVSGSTHGYDVTDANEIDPALGGRAGFDRLTERLAAAGMGLILDIVPNHMAASPENGWWRDVLTFGRQSAYAGHFDIDWREPLTLPQLGQHFEEALAAGELRLVLDETHGNFALAYFQTLLPLNPSSYGALANRLDDPVAMRMAEAAVTSSADFARALRDILFEGGDRAILRQKLEDVSSDHEFLRSLHEEQHWRLSHWKEGARHLSYRRFFEVTGLVGTRVEDPPVFQDLHRLVLELVRQGKVQGLRIDHVDGLAEPKAYLDRLRAAVGADIYIVVEKILGAGEVLPESWPVAGTTGYEFIAALNELFIDAGGLRLLDDAYRGLAGEAADPEEGRRLARQQMVERNFAGETSRLVAIATSIFPDLNSAEIAAAVGELLIASPVYRTYGDGGPLSWQDSAVLAVTASQVMAELDDRRALDHVLKLLEGKIDGDAAHEFRIRFQQLSGPVMAKAVEDTLFYRYNRLLAANEVGSEPGKPPEGPDGFHRRMAERARLQPHGLSATATHDTKRGEDARARLYALSEGADVFAQAVARWREMNRPWLQDLPNGVAPEPNTEWMLYQALAGVWPEDFDRGQMEELRDRFTGYAIKAVREAKLRTAWTEQDNAYEEAVTSYAAALLSPDNDAFLEDFERVLQPFIAAGYVNSLSQTLLKLTAPGIPDIYQGAEGFDFSLVDPDNRRSVDHQQLTAWLDEAGPIAKLQAAALKQRIIGIGLQLRRRQPALFSKGDYLPLKVTGSRRDHLLAFARVQDGDFAIVAAPRLMFGWLDPGVLFAGPEFWEDTTIAVPSPLHGLKADLLIGKTIEPGGSISVSALLGSQPVGLISPI
ncbi:UNVERIFIED_ORG: (1-_4)-alpha-D-glucan 1-alpha-D-glucosylmutase [Rhizobium esperanzae]|uniref:Malto-oligosyltrehalose synthase n=1 Tax=Rhizobium phaseoli TaxID=396 RepID=A0A192TH42_9HYPH|nr:MULTISPECIES: malto-oligosyltrehalose synthase [Rhizobium]MDH6648286.1 (1->4)-alpha-D-glucan 1-alpha-D-glucosylmutase [Rhizobium esperanzae]ANL43085.1 maltooligosyl trehalose synthase [Rhizobium phaseoli]ANL56084.1 maltooligosyl trehalose synthase [Rhizobium phaseoli]ANL62071.1 maltooligosyl trehalose synthase [Rhizobium phaseoli]ANL87484.1 maltooligosyl trehalose synthase [Rhizobium phaseoli]